MDSAETEAKTTIRPTTTGGTDGRPRARTQHHSSRSSKPHNSSDFHNWRPMSSTSEKRVERRAPRGRPLALLALSAALCWQVISDNEWPQVAGAQSALFSPLAGYLPSSSSLAAPSSILKRDLSARQEQADSRAPQQRQANVCQVSDGESVAIVEIEESRGSDMSQQTNPMELPISGSVKRGEIELKIESETHRYFQIQDKRLRLTRPLDRDAVLRENSTQIAQQPISSIYIQISCLDKRPGQEAQTRKVIIPVLVKVMDLNDNAPKFSAPVYNVQLSELTPVDAVVTDQVQAIDLDSANNGLVEYSLRPSGVRPRLVQRAPAEATTPSELQASHTSPSLTAADLQASHTNPSMRSTASDLRSSYTTLASIPESSPASDLANSSPAGSASPDAARGPTIDLNSEPIVNGPMEEGEEEAESDEALLAAMNSTEPEEPSESGALRVPAGGRRRREAATPVSLPDAEPVTRPRADLWTNLMAGGGAGGPSEDLLLADRPLGAELTFPGSALRGAPPVDSSDYFVLETLPNSSRPVIKLRKPLDYETRRVHVLTVVATDRASNRQERLSSSATVVVRVLDGDDQGPAFVLDQGGCATRAVTQTTASSLIAPESARSERRRRRDLAEEPHLPKGFKVSDENFDFGDMSTGDEPEEEHLLRLLLLDGAGAGSAPADGGSARPQRLVPQASEVAQTTTPALRATARPGHYLPNYSCLQSAPDASAGGQAEYFATVMSGDSDYVLRVAPQAIKARDRDELNAHIRYSFINGTPSNYSAYFQINPLDATIKQVAPLDKGQVGRFVIWLQAQEQTVNKLSSLARLTIDVVPSDKNPPVLLPNAYLGFVDENSPVGTRVFAAPASVADFNRSQAAHLRLQVLDGDEQRGAQLYEFETTSDAFKITRDGYVYVNRWPLDRDLPSQAVHLLQVTARQIGLASSRSLSSPVSINITLLDLNDNAPQIANSSLVPIQLTADSRAARTIATIEALDRDLPENARSLFSIRHVSNGGRERFRINEHTGELEALGRFNAGEQFSLTLQVTDELARTSQAILEVQVVPGPNTGGPQFVVDPSGDGDNSRGYSIEINEGLKPNSPLLQLVARDPENDPISYSIVDGNVNSDFYINSKTGVLYTANKLDREEVSAYHLLVQARDSGGLATNRPVHIQVADNNDENPVFAKQSYLFSVREGSAGQVIGRVFATDADAGENGQLSYFLDGPSVASFAIDERSGELRLLEPLDYERAKSHSLLVTARDHGEQPRSTTVQVQVRVQDVQDEAPYFERYHLEARVAENMAQQRIAQVQARDPDSEAQVTYVLKSGDASLFSVDPQTGVVSSLGGFDYEESRSHILLVGTLENEERDLVEAANLLAAALTSGLHVERSSLCRIDVTVVDVNDNAPQFLHQPLPVRVQDSAQLGTLLANLSAVDRDGTAPNNQVRYELVRVQSESSTGEVTSERCAQAFMVDATSGAVSLRADLRRDTQSECQLVVSARDLGQQPQPLSSSVTLTVFIDHLAEISPASMIGFADTQFTVELEENSAANTLVKVLPVVNKPKVNFPMSCEIVSGNELGKFYISENEQRDCELRTRDQLIDYELRQRYSLTLRLNTIGGSAKTVAQVNVNILDVNDNRPLFQQPSRYSQLTQGRFLAAIASDAPSETQVLQLRATDADSSHSNGLVAYEILNDNELEGRFKVDPSNGIVRTSRPVEDIPSTRLPLRLRVLARDNPEVAGNALESVAELVVNLIDDRHRIVLALKDTTTGHALDNKEEILSAIQERTGLISGLEKAESLKIQRNNTLEPDVSGTDFWFYLIEPGTFRIVPSEDVRVRNSLFEQRSQNSLLDVLGQTLGLTKAKVRLPFSLTSGTVGRSSSILFSRSLGSANSLASMLILIALFIAITSAIVIIYQCGSWSSYSQAAKERLYLQQQQKHTYYPYAGLNLAKGSHNPHDNYAFQSGLSTLVPDSQLRASQQQQVADAALYQLETQPQAAMLASGGKEYETQMLKMSVLFDDINSVDEQNQNENNISKNLS